MGYFHNFPSAAFIVAIIQKTRLSMLMTIIRKKHRKKRRTNTGFIDVKTIDIKKKIIIINI